METTSTQTFHRDRGNGYQGSPMAQLMSQHKELSDEVIYMCQQVANLSSKKFLLKSDIVELKGGTKEWLVAATFSV